jgi:hypothetical protein
MVKSINKSVNCRLLIADYFESLRFELDIYTEESLKKVKDNGQFDEKVLFAIKPFKSNEKPKLINKVKPDTIKFYENEAEIDPYSTEYKYDNDNQIHPEEMSNLTVEEYLNKTRAKIISELEKLEKEALKYFNTNSSRFPVEIHKFNEQQINQLTSQLFANKFCFLMNFDQNNTAKIFKLSLVVIDFYLEPFYIQHLK